MIEEIFVRFAGKKERDLLGNGVNLLKQMKHSDW
jgi:hypothetical protein